MKNNYKAWEINLEEFNNLSSEEEKLRFLINFAVLAPSSHNSQPWAFSVSDNYIKITKDDNRSLPVGDSNDRQLYISLGCALENILVAANYYGYSTEVKIENDIFVSLSKDGVQENDLALSIPKRMVNRSKYKDQQISNDLMSQIKSLESDELKISIIQDEKIKSDLADVALDATAESMSNKSFRSELSKYVISNTSSKKIGMPGFGLGFPTPPSYFAPFMLKNFDLSKITKKQDEPLLKKFTPYMVVISTKENNEKSWVEAGRVFQKLSLMACKEDVSFAVWAAPIQIGDHYKKVQELLGIDFRPQMFFRMGYATSDMGGHSPRIPANEVTSK